MISEPAVSLLENLVHLFACYFHEDAVGEFAFEEMDDPTFDVAFEGLLRGMGRRGLFRFE